MSASSNLDDLSESSPDLEARRMAKFKPSPWGDKFLHYTPDTKAIEAQQEEAKELKEGIYKELLYVRHKPLIEQLCLIDSIGRLGVAYHFEKEIDDALQRIHDTANTSSDDLFLTSLRFRLLRQHGFKVSCDVFKGLINSKGSLNGVVASDVQGLVSLYEACHIRIHGEGILEEVVILAKSKLKSIQVELSHPVLGEQVSYALNKAFHKRTNYVTSVLTYMKVYEKDPTHNKRLLLFAKINYNLLQSLYKKELSDIMTRWWKHRNVSKKLPIRDRIVECYFWAVSVHHEPHYSLGRKMFAVSAQILTSLDDLYDAYGTIEELQIFTDAVERWDKSGLDQLIQLPQGYRWFYQTLLLDAYEEMESDLAAQGRSSLYVNYAREETKALCRTYLIEVSWRKKKYIPTFDEYMEIVVRNSGFVAQTASTFLHTNDATNEDFEWLSSLSKPVKALCLILRILNDIASPEFDKTRGHSPFSIASYMRQYDVPYEQACKVLLEKTHELWKDLNEAMILPTEVPMPLLKSILNMARLMDYTYDGGVDAYTAVNKGMKKDIMNLFMNPIPI